MWYAVVNRQTGEAASFGTEVAAELAPDLEALPLPGPPDFARQRWDAPGRRLVAKVQRDRADDFFAAADLPVLAQPIKSKLREILIRVFPDDLRIYEAGG